MSSEATPSHWSCDHGGNPGPCVYCSPDPVPVEQPERRQVVLRTGVGCDTTLTFSPEAVPLALTGARDLLDVARELSTDAGDLAALSMPMNAIDFITSKEADRG